MTDSSGSLRRIAIGLFDGVEELDAVGPWEVLSFWAGSHPGDGWEVVLTSADCGAATAAKGTATSTTETFIASAGLSGASTWPCTWSSGSSVSNAPARYAAVSSTTLDLRSERNGHGTDGRLCGRGRTGPGIMRPRMR